MPSVFGPGFGRLGALLSLGGFTPPFIGTNSIPDVFFDFAAGNYSAGAAQYPSASALMTALGGTYTRASNATYIKSGLLQTASSNVMRFTGNGLRLTGPGTNFQLQSQSFTNAEYTKQDASDTVTDNVGTAPDGTATASTFLQSATTGTHNFFGSQNVLTNASPYTYSVFAKKNAGAPILQIFPSLLAGGGCAGNFDLTNGTATSIAGTGSGVASIFPLANGWFLCSLTFVAQAAGSRMFIGVVNSTASGANASETGDGVRSALIWGAQTTNSAIQLDYIPTTTASVTQAADSFSFPFTQRTFSALVSFNGVLFDGTGAQRLLDCNATTPLWVQSATVLATFNGTTGLGGPTITNVSNPHKGMVAGNGTNTWVTADGLTPNTAAQAINTSAPTAAFLGSMTGSSIFAPSDYKQLAIWNGLVASTSDMQRLTT